MIELESLHRIIETIDVDSILECYRQLESQIQFTEYGHKGSQAGVQYHADDDNPWTSAVGRSRGRELEYTELNPILKDTIFETIVNRYQFKKTRLMWVYPYACYTMHRDSTPRVHIPLVTNKETYFVFQRGLIKHLEPGFVHYTDTRVRHTFMNCSDEKRLHIVGAVEENWINQYLTLTQL
jgi:hypothetical protein